MKKIFKNTGMKRNCLAGIICFFAAAALAFGSSSDSETEEAMRRFGIFIGSNNGGRDRVTLRYAVSDARAVSKVFSEMGGIAGQDAILLIEPSIRDINNHIDMLREHVIRSGGINKRTEIVFYYSGHSDEEGLLLNREKFLYRELRDRINNIPSNMRVVILDSCASGAFTRIKGGAKTMPFLVDNSLSADGYAFLTSSSANESSQESDRIKGSYFTHSLVAGLRGAADSVGDGRVTLNELYRFAYTETLANTETSVYGAQHPSYDIQVIGTGDLVLTDIRGTSASLFIDENLTGRITIRDSSDFLVAELTKVNQKPMELGLEPGLYRITLQRGDNFYRAELLLRENTRTPLGMDDFIRIASASGNRTRGDDFAESPEDVPLHPTNLQFLPGMDIQGHGGELASNYFLFGLFIGMGHNIRGAGIASLGLINSGYVQGVQISGLFNTAEGYLKGFQASSFFNTAGSDVFGFQTSGLFNYAEANVTGIQTTGLFNYAGADVTGVQTAGLFNWTTGDMNGFQIGTVNWTTRDMKGFQVGAVNRSGEGDSYGVQIGVVNVSGSENVIPIGLVNIVKGGMIHPSVYVDDLKFLNASFRSGSKYFYSRIDIGAGGGIFPGQEGDKLIASRAGFGFEYPVNNFFISVEAISGTIINVSSLEMPHDDGTRDYWMNYWIDSEKSKTQLTQLRLTAGYKVFEHLGIFAGISYDHLYRYSYTSPDPEDFGMPALSKAFGRHMHKMGFFGGVQF